MPKYLEVELSTGETVKVYAPPTLKLSGLLESQYPDPDPPVEEVKSASGETKKYLLVDDLEYKAKLEAVEELRSEKLNELTVLSALRDVRPADGFYDEFEYLALMADPEWKPRDGDNGKRLDYIEWVLLANVADQVKVQRALAELSGIDLDAISAIEDSFRGNVAEETDQVLVEQEKEEGGTGN